MEKERNTNHEELRRISAEKFDKTPERFELRSGLDPGAPSCPFGGRYAWIGYDLEKEEYVRFTKSVFKRLVNSLDNNYVKANEAAHSWYKQKIGHGIEH